MKKIILITSLTMLSIRAFGYVEFSNENDYSNLINLNNPMEIFESNDADSYYCIDLKVSTTSHVFQTFCDEDPSVASQSCNADANSHSTDSAHFYCGNLRRVYR